RKVLYWSALIAAAAGSGDVTGPSAWIAKGAGVLAVTLASVNIFGGFMVTRRMLAMYKKKERPAPKSAA
ncbi:MAG: proton-translocating transhydrogenase family protein, partial [Brevundimonas sp.]